MPIKLIGEYPLAKKEDGSFKNNIGYVFPEENVLVTGTGIHAELLFRYLNYVDEERRKQGLQPLAEKEKNSLEDKLCSSNVPLHIRKGYVYIRPNPDEMRLAFSADELLQEIVPKEKIKFLGVLDKRIRHSIKQRGELWRINYLPKTTQEIKVMISDSKDSIGCRQIYYHNMETGTRYLTYDEFSKLGNLEYSELAKHLQEIKENCRKTNAFMQRELRFFMADETFNLDNYTEEDFTKYDEAKLKACYEVLKARFEAAVRPEFRKDDPENEEWRKAMLSALIGEHDEVISEEILLGLCPEFFMHIQWLPGARIECGELIFDPVFEKKMDEKEGAYDEKVKDIIFNFKRRYVDIEYINIGRIIDSLSKREKMPGRREVYIAEIKIKEKEKEEVKIIRLQKFGAVELLESGEEKDIFKAFWRSQEYKRYTLDRWTGCKQLGMNILPITEGEIFKTINEIEVPLVYFERDYVDGRASDKISASKYGNKDYALRFAELLGDAAAPNMILGRTNNGKVLFDDGDEIIIEDEKGLPSKIVVADMTGSFWDYNSSLDKFADAYAMPVIKRAKFFSDINEFANAYIMAFVKRFKEIQHECRTKKKAFYSLFKDRRYDPKGSLAYRWEKILERLEKTDPDALGALIMSYIKKEIK